MTRPLLAFLLALLGLNAATASAHRLDELLQAATVRLASDHVGLRVRLTPGVGVAAAVLAELDADLDGAISDAERSRYAERVRGDLAMSVDGIPLTLRPIASTFADAPAMRDGIGDIELTFEATLPPTTDATRRLTLENRHDPASSVYLADCLVPDDDAVRVVGQDRTADQSTYRVDFTVGPTPAAAGTEPAEPARPSAGGERSLVVAYGYAGVRHILTGYDHLLFVGALVLAARTLWELVKVVSAFTVAHTLTLALAAMNLVHVPARVVEPMIAASIVVVALQNVCWPRAASGRGRLAVACFFGLFHGLGFAGGLLDAMREMGGGQLALAIVAFSLGVELGHQMIVLPLFAALKLMRRTGAERDASPRPAARLRRLASAGISIAGAYYLCVALI